VNESLPSDKPTVIYAHREDLEGIFARQKHSVDDQGDYWIETMQRGESKKCLWIFGLHWATARQTTLFQ
jgi:hypothetical protein